MLRNPLIDYIRATAIVFMVVFHIFWDLNFFGYISVDTPHGPFWREFRALIVSMFLFSVGVSLVYAYQNHISFAHYGKRLLKLTIASLLVTFSSMVTTPNHWVYFGILHFIAFATLVCIWLVNKPILCLTFSSVFMAGYWLFDIPGNWPFIYIQNILPSYTVDLVTPFPWLALPLLGIWAGHLPVFQKISDQHPVNFDKIVYLSKNSLIIYLVHQPVLLGLLYAYAYLSQ